ncbi:hypothetical protein NADFUDRAFT_66207 [Nadsonia fulvescens var. elongata DSM 6958]|uniref:EIF3F/CSN6-like C-terminal domain-containing protein n=1 Tax=Nadsonia fulvescens var. elongata DSM 6958 TaxID=857566 RepID=A0A1E3PJS4_9ASCO|nr:hypothetical protein NADFUDRAFT_66207 [Nadsonia fulvescens var. elongata DSM 6958]
MEQSLPLPTTPAAQNSSSLTVALHVLPLLNISDYITRIQYTSGVFAGVLLGRNDVKEITIESMFEVKVLSDNRLDPDCLAARLSQFQTSFPEYELTGFFYLSDQQNLDLNSEALAFYNQLLPFNSSPLIMIMNSNLITTDGTKELPLKIYEPYNVGGSKKFKQVAYRIETGEAERIAVDGIMKESSVQGTNDSDELVSLLTLQSNALRMFNDRLVIVNNYINDVCTDKVKPDFRILNQIDALVSKVSLGASTLLSDAKKVQELDILVSTILSAISKGTHIVMDLESKGVIARA